MTLKKLNKIVFVISLVSAALTFIFTMLKVWIPINYPYTPWYQFMENLAISFVWLAITSGGMCVILSLYRNKK